jgi:hypothetical protein
MLIAVRKESSGQEGEKGGLLYAKRVTRASRSGDFRLPLLVT